MGKAGKWIRNFLLGKKEEKLKQIDTFCNNENNKSANMSSGNNKMVVKRRWSFRKLTSGRLITGKAAAAAHKFSRSFDSGDDSTIMQIQALLEAQIPRCLPKALAKVSADTKFEKTAATKIQAAFRSYLAFGLGLMYVLHANFQARKALLALRGLVKLQALVRGHLVRKQTTATLRGMHALMSIQVRARINRIQMVEEANLLGKQPPQHTQEIPYFKGLMTQENKDSRNMRLEEMVRVMKSRSGPLDGSHVKSRNYDSMALYSKRLSVSKRENQFKENTTTTTTITAPNSPTNYWEVIESNPITMALSTSQRQLVPHRQSWSPNYMNKTESSRAKTRSRSEPKQRPKEGIKHESKCAESQLNGPMQNRLSNSSRFDYWVTNLRGSVKDSKRDSLGSSTVTSDSYYY